jgi:hypothetical protein
MASERYDISAKTGGEIAGMGLVLGKNFVPLKHAAKGEPERPHRVALKRTVFEPRPNRLD